MPYRVKDLMINVIGNGGGTAYPADDTTPVPTPITPIAMPMALVALSPQLDFVSPIVREALAGEHIGFNSKAEAIGRAALGGSEGATAFVAAGRKIAGVMVGAAVFQHGGGAGMPNPECDGTSLETIPTPLTDYIRQASTLLQPEHLPRLKTRLTEMLRAVEAAEQVLVPTGKVASDLRERMKVALTEFDRLERVPAAAV
jgi:hypothetical protein